MTSTKPKILVMGSAGYLGSHAALLLEQSGDDVQVLAHVIDGQEERLKAAVKAELRVGEAESRGLLENIDATHKSAEVINGEDIVSQYGGCHHCIMTKE